jgi:hypothetical protein
MVSETNVLKARSRFLILFSHSITFLFCLTFLGIGKSQTLLPGSVGASQTVCAGALPTAFVSSSPASGGVGSITYTWQSSTTSTSSGFSNIPGTNSTTYSPGSLSSTTYFRRAADTPSNNTAYTNVLTVSVTPIPSLSITGPSIVCQFDTTLLIVSGASSYTWLPYGVISNSIILNPLAPETQTIIASSINGCTASIISTVNVYPPTSSIYINRFPSLVCGEDTITFEAYGCLNYTWNPGNITGSVVLTTYSNLPTHYTITGVNINGCKSYAISPPVWQTTSMDIGVTSSKSPSICLGWTTTLVASSYFTPTTWLPGGFTGTSIVVSPSVNTTYTVFGKSATCSDTSEFQLTVFPLPTITIVQSPSIICLGSSGTLTASGANAYVWSGFSFNETKLITPTASATYSVRGTEYQYGCYNTASITINFSKCIGIPDFSSDELFSLFPNPNNGDFMLHATNDTELIFYDALGKRLYDCSLSASNGFIKNITGFTKGLYFVTLSVDGRLLTRKLIVE